MDMRLLLNDTDNVIRLRSTDPNMPSIVEMTRGCSVRHVISRAPNYVIINQGCNLCSSTPVFFRLANFSAGRWILLLAWKCCEW